MATADYSSDAIPAHVPASAIHEFTLSRLSPAVSDPFDVLIPEIHKGPDVFFAPKSHPYGFGAWVFRRADEIRKAFLDNEHFSVADTVQISDFLGEKWDLIPTGLNPPEHSKYRQLLNPMFSPSRMVALDDQVREQANRLLDRLVDRSGCEFMHDFAVPFPVAIFLRLLGMSLDEMDQYVEWEHIASHNSYPERKGEAVIGIRDSLMAAMRERRAAPQDDVLSRLVAGEIDGRKLNDQELLRTALNLFLAGLDTVTATLGWMFKHLATHPEDQQRLRDDPSVLDSAVEELLRAFAPVTVSRVCAKDFTASNGCVIRTGDRVLLSTSVAARDPKAYPDSDKIILDRQPIHMTFAYGIHRCLGSHLARRELRIGLETFLKRLPPFRLATDKPLPMYFGPVLGITSLPLAWDN
jgi:cytochrome P450